jgi:hypothetical protein
MNSVKYGLYSAVIGEVGFICFSLQAFVFPPFASFPTDCSLKLVRYGFIDDCTPLCTLYENLLVAVKLTCQGMYPIDMQDTPSVACMRKSSGQKATFTLSKLKFSPLARADQRFCP